MYSYLEKRRNKMTISSVIATLENSKARVEKKLDQIAGYPIWRNDTYAWGLIEEARRIDEWLKEARKMQEEENKI
jgi:hypothetical protein